jgi:hypothetical protein
MAMSNEDLIKIGDVFSKILEAHEAKFLEKQKEIFKECLEEDRHKHSPAYEKDFLPQEKYIKHIGIGRNRFFALKKDGVFNNAMHKANKKKYNKFFDWKAEMLKMTPKTNSINK